MTANHQKPPRLTTRRPIHHGKHETARSIVGYHGPLVGVALTILVTFCSLQHAAQACKQVATYYGIACECSESYCDSEIRFEWPEDDASLLRMVSDEAGARFQLDSLPLTRPPLANTTNATATSNGAATKPRVHFRVALDVNKRHQQVVGYGGALTDSASMLIKQRLSAKCSSQLMRSYFSPTGLNYNLVRVPIGGTDMSWRPYSYDDLPVGDEDFELGRFKLQPEDLDYKLPLIRWARSLRAGSEPLRLLASSWSAPNWMKSNNKLVQGRLKDDSEGVEHAATSDGHGKHRGLDGMYYDAYARYIIRFLDEYERQLSTEGEPFKFWALTPQNEPCTPSRLGHQVVNYNSVNFTPEQMGRFVRAHLVPNLLRSNRTARDIALFLWDDAAVGLDEYKRHLFPLSSNATSSTAPANKSGGGRARPHVKHAAANDPAPSALSQEDEQLKAASHEYVRGLALHWYSQGTDKVPYYTLYDIRKWLPSKFSIISTEASHLGRPQPGNWQRGEKYARDIIIHLRTGGLGWIDWNMALNELGGPTWSRNFLDSAVIVQEASESYLKNPMFYTIGHLSRFIKAGSRVVESQVWSAIERGDGMQTWRFVDEQAEGGSEVLAVASELAHEASPNRTETRWRQIALVLLNRAAGRRRVSLSVSNCKSRALADRNNQLELELNAKSITSLAFNC